MHAMIALRRDEPHWMLNDADARVYGQALQNALRHIPLKRAQKSLDFAMLVVAACQFEIPRIYLSNQLAKARRQPRPAGQVFQFRQPPSSPSTNPAGNNVPPVMPAGGASEFSGLRSPPSSASTNGATAAGLDMSIEPESVEPHFGPQ